MTTQMKILNLIIGSPEWKDIRTKYRVASEAPAMMGADPNLKRSELLRLKATGLERVFDEWVEKIVFKRGHEVEALARPIAEKRIGDDLYALVGVRNVDGVDMLASYDGITVPLYDLHWEHKQYNKELYELVKGGGELEPKHYWQLEHQLAVNGNAYCIFAVSDGTEENYAQLEYHSRPERRAQLIAGWKIFDKDLENWVAEELKPAVIGEVIKALPALTIELASEVRKNNFPVYRLNAMDFINSINEDLQTDEDFANAKKIAKFLGEEEKILATVKQKLLDGSQDTGEIMRGIDQLEKTLQQKRLTLDKLVVSEEQNRKAEAIAAAKKEWDDYCEAINAQLQDGVKLPTITPDFAGAGKGKRNLATYKEAIKNELLRVRIEADNWAAKIEGNLALLKALAPDHMFLFKDLQTLIVKDKEALEAIAKLRVSEHQAADAARIKAAAEKITAENERKRLAEVDRLQRHKDAIEKIRGYLDPTHMDKEPAEIEGLRSTLEAMAPSTALEEFLAEATEVYWDAHAYLQKAHKEAARRENNQTPTAGNEASHPAPAPAPAPAPTTAPAPAQSDLVSEYESLQKQVGARRSSGRSKPVPPPPGKHFTPPAYAARNQRPTDREMIAVLAAQYSESHIQIIEWLKDLDLVAAEKEFQKQDEKSA